MTVKDAIEKLKEFNPKLEVEIEIFDTLKPITRISKMKVKKVSKHSDRRTIVTIG